MIGKESTVVRCWLRWSYSRHVTRLGMENTDRPTDEMVWLTTVVVVVAVDEVTVESRLREGGVVGLSQIMVNLLV